MAHKSAPIRTSCFNKARCADAKGASAYREKRAKRQQIKATDKKTTAKFNR
ncbi:MAG: hypothetical protein HQM04_07140 [Magnetococcales bacterium]|nr:hypothetical protein [Magnetococcales bacterium]MBF0114804.1 hypothetical protein [Magnetococcales bacterium]